MEKSEKERLIDMIAITAQISSTNLTPEAAMVMVEDLEDYSFSQVMDALKRCRRTLKGPLTPQAIISRIDDGRPGPEEAWAMIPKNEGTSVVWTEEMAEAFGVVNDLIIAGEEVQARMAFLEVYRDRVDQARMNRIAVKWIPSLGHDPYGRDHVLLDAVEKGRITAKYAITLLPCRRDQSDVYERLVQLTYQENKQLTVADKKIKELTNV